MWQRWLVTLPKIHTSPQKDALRLAKIPTTRPVVVVGMARCFALERYRVGAAVESSALPRAFTGEPPLGATWPGAWWSWERDERRAL